MTSSMLGKVSLRGQDGILLEMATTQVDVVKDSLCGQCSQVVRKLALVRKITSNVYWLAEIP